jgi:hypothetical protein
MFQSLPKSPQSGSKNLSLWPTETFYIQTILTANAFSELAGKKSDAFILTWMIAYKVDDGPTGVT